MSPTFLIDIDDVCVDWTTGFFRYMTKIGHKPKSQVCYTWDLGPIFPELSSNDIYKAAHDFNLSISFLSLQEVEGAAESLAILREYFPHSRFIAVSSGGNEDLITSARMYQLRNFHFETSEFLPIHSCKKVVYAKYPDAVVIDDHTTNILASIEAGHARSILFSRPSNMTFRSDAPGFRRAANWAEVVRLFTNMGEML